MESAAVTQRSVSEDNNDLNWNFFGKTIARSKAVFISQVIILYVVILTCIVNLSMGNSLGEVWISLLSYSLGSILPSPKIKKRLT